MNQELREKLESTRLAYREQIVTALHSGAAYEAIARDFGVSAGYVYRVARLNGLRRRADADAYQRKLSAK